MERQKRRREGVELASAWWGNEGRLRDDWSLRLRQKLAMPVLLISRGAQLTPSFGPAEKRSDQASPRLEIHGELSGWEAFVPLTQQVV